MSDEYVHDLAQEIHELTDIVSSLASRVEALEVGTSRFIRPTLDDVRDVMLVYCRQANIRTDANPQEFIDFYESNGWKVGRNKMKSWESAARNWCRRNRKAENKKGTEAYHRHGL